MVGGLTTLVGMFLWAPIARDLRDWNIMLIPGAILTGAALGAYQNGWVPSSFGAQWIPGGR